MGIVARVKRLDNPITTGTALSPGSSGASTVYKVVYSIQLCVLIILIVLMV